MLFFFSRLAEINFYVNYSYSYSQQEVVHRRVDTNARNMNNGLERQCASLSHLQNEGFISWPPLKSQNHNYKSWMGPWKPYTLPSIPINDTKLPPASKKTEAHALSLSSLQLLPTTTLQRIKTSLPSVFVLDILFKDLINNSPCSQSSGHLKPLDQLQPGLQEERHGLACLTACPHALDSHICRCSRRPLWAVLTAHLAPGRGLSPLGAEEVIRNPEASALVSSLLNGVSGVHLKSLLGQPWYTWKLNRGSTAYILLENFHRICSELTK